VIKEKAAEFARIGHVFCGYQTAYSETEDYGIGFLGRRIVEDEIAGHATLEYCGTVAGATSGFGQDLAIVRKRR
jgi:hypothetical protein